MRLSLFAFFIFFSTYAFGASAKEITIQSSAVLKQFKKEITGGEEFLKQAVAVLVFPEVIKGGFGIGGEYGEGVLQKGTKSVAYYSMAGLSFGLQLGAQTKSIIMVFLTKKAYNDFTTSEGWKVGVDGSVALLKWGAGKDISSMNIKDPIVGFVLNNKGLMYNLTLEGTKITKIAR
jgi:lipid-binding SYLF domain-containing protein